MIRIAMVHLMLSPLQEEIEDRLSAATTARLDIYCLLAKTVYINVKIAANRKPSQQVSRGITNTGD